MNDCREERKALRPATLCCLENVKLLMHSVQLNEVITQLEKGLRSLVNME